MTKRADANCQDPVCGSKKSSFMAALGPRRPVSSMTESQKENPSTPIECPVDREELGRNTWSLLHTIAAYYPDQPSTLRQKQCTQFMMALGELFPCRHCAEDFRHCLQDSPPKVETRTALSVWLCEQHNMVNEKIGKEPFPCTMEALDRRWKTGQPGCWSEDDENSADSLGQE